MRRWGVGQHKETSIKLQLKYTHINHSFSKEDIFCFEANIYRKPQKSSVLCCYFDSFNTNTQTRTRSRIHELSRKFVRTHQYRGACNNRQRTNGKRKWNIRNVLTTTTKTPVAKTNDCDNGRLLFWASIIIHSRFLVKRRGFNYSDKFTFRPTRLTYGIYWVVCVCVSLNPFLRFHSSIYPKTQVATLSIANILSISRTTAFQIVAGLHYVLFCFRVNPFQFSQS